MIHDGCRNYISCKNFEGHLEECPGAQTYDWKQEKCVEPKENTTKLCPKNPAPLQVTVDHVWIWRTFVNVVTRSNGNFLQTATRRLVLMKGPPSQLKKSPLLATDGEEEASGNRRYQHKH